MTTAPTTSLKPIVLIAVVALVIRIAVGLAVGWDRLLPAADQPLYDAFAKNILVGRGFQIPDIFDQDAKRGVVHEDVKKLGYFGVVQPNRPTAFFPPAYPVMMAAAYAVFGPYPGSVRLFQSFFDALACFLVGWMGVRLFGQRQGVLAALIYAAYPAFIGLTTVLWTIGLGVFTLVLAMALTVHFQQNPTGWSALWMGMAWGLNELSRAATLPLMILVLVLAWWQIRRAMRTDDPDEQSQKKLRSSHQWKYPLIVAAGIALVAMPWAVRNAIVMGHFTTTPTKGGRNLWEANNCVFSKPYLNFSATADGVTSLYHQYALSRLDKLHRTDLIEFPDFPQEMDEFQRDRALTRRVIDFLRANPKVAVELAALRFYSLIRIVPAFLPAWIGKLAGALSMGLVLIGGFLGLVIHARRWKYYSYFYLLVLYYVAVHTVAAAGIPHRLPLDAVLILFASSALYWLLDRLTRSNSTSYSKTD